MSALGRCSVPLRHCATKARGRSPCIAAVRYPLPSTSHIAPKLASHSSTAFASIVLNTGSVSVGELLIRLRISAVAACCSRASSRSRVRLSSCCRRLAVEERRRRGSALRRFSVVALRRCDLARSPPALERRLIAHPKGLGLRRFSKWDYIRDLRSAEWGSTVILLCARLPPTRMYRKSLLASHRSKSAVEKIF